MSRQLSGRARRGMSSKVALLAIVLLALLGKLTDALLGMIERKALVRWA